MNNNECIICFDLIDIEKEVIKLFKNCEHNNYHFKCINEWINNCNKKNIHPSCPICSKELEIIVINDPIIESVQNNTRPYIKYGCICTTFIFITIIIIEYLKS